MKKASNFVYVIIACLILSLGVFGQKLPASPIKTIYVIPSSHYDLGFVEPPNAIRERVWSANRFDGHMKFCSHINSRTHIEVMERRGRWFEATPGVMAASACRRGSRSS